MTETSDFQVALEPLVSLEAIVPLMRPRSRSDSTFWDDARQMRVLISAGEPYGRPNSPGSFPVLPIEISFHPAMNPGDLVVPADTDFFRAVWGDGARAPELARLTGDCTTVNGEFVTRISRIAMKMAAKPAAPRFRFGHADSAALIPAGIRELAVDPRSLLIYASALFFNHEFKSLFSSARHFFAAQKAVLVWPHEFISDNSFSPDWKPLDYFEGDTPSGRIRKDGSFVFGALEFK
jgi:hypothetical protein